MPRMYVVAGQNVLNIGGNDQGFHDRVERSLEKIRQTAAGAALLAEIQQNRIAGKNVGIVAGLNSSCAFVSPQSSDSRTLLAQAFFDAPNTIPAELDACLTASGHQNDYGWLAARLNQTPCYDIVGLPNAAPSNLGVTAQHIDDWINNRQVFPAPFNAGQRSTLERVILTAMWDWARARPGNGGHSRVTWNKDSRSIGLTTGVRNTRSKSIGLAHELVHAMYNARGLQMGRDNPEPDDNGIPTQPSAALFEYQCVGLGIWANENISENAIRAQWHGVVSNTLFGGRVQRHYGICAARPAY